MLLIMSPVNSESTTDQPAAGANILVPAQLLQPGEIIVLLIKPSPWFIVLGALRALATVLVLLLAALWLRETGTLGVARRDLILIAIGLIVVRLTWQFLEWISRVYVLTDRRVIRVKGVIRVQVFETALKHVQHTDTLFSLRERLFGLGTIAFSTAGTAAPEAYWVMVAEPLDVHRKVVEALNRYR